MRSEPNDTSAGSGQTTGPTGGTPSAPKSGNKKIPLLFFVAVAVVIVLVVVFSHHG